MKPSPLAVILASLILLPGFSFAQAGGATPPEVAQELSVMTTKLNLSPDQQDRIRLILIDELEKRKAIEAGALSDKEKHDKIFANHRAALQKIKALFTPEQMALFAPPPPEPR